MYAFGDNSSGFVETCCSALLFLDLLYSLGGKVGRCLEGLEERTRSFSITGGGVRETVGSAGGDTSERRGRSGGAMRSSKV